MAADPYTTLGVNRSASAEEIKKAYRKLAHQYHPDKKGGNEAKFKEVNEAYQMLNDPQKKERFDRFGHAGAQGGAGGFDFDFSQFSGGGGFESIFDMFSGGFSAPQRPSRAEKGEDIHLEIGVTSKDLGKRKVYAFEAFEACDVCDGTGAKNRAFNTCVTCGGQGRVRQSVRTPLGMFAQVVECPKCSGEGRIPEKTCDICAGAGRLKEQRKLEVQLPKEIKDRYLMAFPQEGNAGLRGTPSGDLLVTLRMR